MPITVTSSDGFSFGFSVGSGTLLFLCAGIVLDGHRHKFPSLRSEFVSRVESGHLRMKLNMKSGRVHQRLQITAIIAAATTSAPIK